MIKIQQQKYFGSIDEFHIFEDKIIGNGSFGVVKLAIHIRTCKVYALKIMSLKNFTTEEQYKVMQRQTTLHSRADHPHIIKLWDTITENQTLFMIMEYAEKGNLFYYQNLRTVFEEKEAFKFFSQTVSAVRYLHEQKIIHRDLKPENILLDSDYNVKLCDFGWCTAKLSEKRSTFCGTYEYMAPEMIFSREYDYRIDIWALGILLFELLHGFAPFKGNSAKQVRQKMQLGAYSINNTLSQECKDIVIQILKFDPNDRPSIQDIGVCSWAVKMEEAIGLHYGFRPAHKAYNPACDKQYFTTIRISQQRSICKDSKSFKDGTIGQLVTKSTLKTSHHKKTSSGIDPKTQKYIPAKKATQNEDSSFFSSKLNSEKYLKCRRQKNDDDNKCNTNRNDSSKVYKLVSGTKYQKSKQKMKKLTKQKASHSQINIQSIDKKNKTKSKSKSKSKQKQKTVKKQRNCQQNHYLSPRRLKKY